MQFYPPNLLQSISFSLKNNFRPAARDTKKRAGFHYARSNKSNESNNQMRFASIL